MMTFSFKPIIKPILAMGFIIYSNLLAAQDMSKKSKLGVAYDDDFSSFALLDSMLPSYNVFFTGEDHRYRKSNSDLELKMLRYLHQKAGVNLFIMEFGQGVSYLVNRYITTGDTNIKKILKLHSYEEYYEQYEGLREYYVSLPQNNKFEIKGIDIERELTYPVKHALLLLPENKKPHDSIQVCVEAFYSLSEYIDKYKEDYLKDKKDYSNDEMYYYNFGRKSYLNANSTLVLIRQNFKAHTDKYREFLGSNFDEFNAIMTRLDQAEYYYDLQGDNAAQHYLYREIVMQKNLEALFTANPALKAYGQFGRCHTALTMAGQECDYYHFNSLAKRLNESDIPALKGKVFSCPMFYPLSSGIKDNTDSDLSGELKPFFNDATKEGLTLYLLDTSNKVKKLNEHYDAIIINYSKDDENSDNKPQKTTRKIEWVTHYTFGLQGGVRYVNMGPVNKALNTHFTNTPIFSGGSIAAVGNKDFGLEFEFNAVEDVEMKLNDSVSVSMGGFRIREGMGSDLARAANFDLFWHLGYGYEQWRMIVNEKFTSPDHKSIFGADRYTKYINPAVIVYFGLSARYYMSPVYISVFVDVQGDISKNKFRSGGHYATETPNMSFTGYSAGVSLGFTIED